MGFLSTEGRKTLLGLLAVGIGLIVWDVVLLGDGVEDTTISAVLRIISRILIVPYGLGVLAGHVFWYKVGPRDDTNLKDRLIIAALIGGILTAVGLAHNDLAPITYLCNHPHVVFVAVGFPVGHFLWPQYRDETGA